MIVEDLREQLKDLPPNLPIVCMDYDNLETFSIDKVFVGDNLKQKEAVFLKLRLQEFIK